MNEKKNQRDPLEWEEVRTEHIVQDEWIDFRRSAYRFPDGTVFEPYYSYSRRDYAVIVATDTEGNYLCVRQYRQGIKQVTTEFPAGGIERKDGREYGTSGDASAEDALEAAKRELLEETGTTAGTFEYLGEIAPIPAYTTEIIHMYLAKGLTFSAPDPDDEFLDVVRIPFEEALEMVLDGRITDSKTMIIIMKAALMKYSGK